MIAFDTSTLQRMFRGELGADTAVARAAWVRREAVLPPVVFAEAFSHPIISEENERQLLTSQILPDLPGYWLRAALLRRTLLLEGRKAKLADCLIAQSCIDHDVPLITYDRDFRHFVRAGLTLA